VPCLKGPALKLDEILLPRLVEVLGKQLGSPERHQEQTLFLIAYITYYPGSSFREFVYRFQCANSHKKLKIDQSRHPWRFTIAFDTAIIDCCAFIGIKSPNHSGGGIMTFGPLTIVSSLSENCQGRDGRAVSCHASRTAIH
jgi:hypothetical protein